MQMQLPVLSTAYLPPIQYLAKCIDNAILIEAHENYVKQSYRNRCTILSANGPISLTIPIEKRHGQKMVITDVKIDYELPWQKIHFKSIESAYKNSPYYDYFIDDFLPFYTQKHRYLFDFNQELFLLILKTLGLKTEVKQTAEFEKAGGAEQDWRYAISPKESQQKADTSFVTTEYYQVFEDKFGFTPNLSIIDLIFNEGPDSKDILLQSIKKGEN